ncbi:MAG TPA: hypothetical protein DCO75_04390 [Fibrobacteres bacterium]|jgi:uncharacterized protein|nr:hypothetical protein [Fibrobacterota bacterium]
MNTTINDLTVLFLSILLEALPFVMLGSIIASVISLFVSDKLLYRFIPKNRAGGLIAASLMGLIFPVCDCTVVPIMRRLIRKGLPSSLAVTFMCAVPIINPAVILSTAWAFTNLPHIIWLRLLVGMSVAIATGFAIGKLTREANPLLNEKDLLTTPEHKGCSCANHECAPDVHECTCSHESHDAGRREGCACGNAGHQHGRYVTESRWAKVSDKIHRFISHTAGEFIDSSALIVIGAFLSSVIQIWAPRTIMYPVAASPTASVGVMMGFTYLISLCSNADAFVAKSFCGIFTTGSVVAFLTFGQMIDLKNTVMLLGFFKKRFIIITIITVAILCFSWGVIINILGRGL